MVRKTGFGGGCHWCTEAVFEALLGVENVEQGWISAKENESFSEAVIVTFDEQKITLETLIAIHLHTHSCTSEHSMREKYRSAIYTFSEDDIPVAKAALANAQKDFVAPVITKVMRFYTFRSNNEQSLHYYSNNPEKPFCKAYIAPKLKDLLDKFSAFADKSKFRP